jgi:hypothetical protein
VGSACAFTLASANSFFTQSGGSGSVNVSSPSGCGWTATVNDGWIVLTSEGGGTGNGVITFELRENFTGSARQGGITIAGQTFNVIQDGGLSDCTYSISPLSKTFPGAGGAASISVASENRCAWQAVSNAGWITVGSGGTGIGDGTVNYSVARNTTGVSRKGNITIGSKVFTVKQK